MINELFVLLQLLSPYGVTEENEIEPFLRSSPEVRFLEYSDYQTLLGLNEKETELVDQLDAFDKVWYFYSCYEAKMSANDNFPANLISNKEGDAFRHTYWSALLCEHIDVETVLSLTYAHEYGTEGALDSQMDLHNDLNGTLLYLEYTQELNEVNDLDNFIMHCVSNGSTYNVVKLNDTNNGLAYTSYMFDMSNVFGNSYHHDVIRNTDFEFEQQYFFYEKSKNCLTFCSCEIETSRIRTGYIEEEYIVLSATRSGAGFADLQITFERPITDIEFDLCLWSNNEQFTEDDSAFVFFYTDEGVCTYYVDLFNDISLPTNRNQPYNLSISFVDNVKSIEIQVNGNSSGSRNKGRLCIGDIYLTYAS